MNIDPPVKTSNEKTAQLTATSTGMAIPAIAAPMSTSATVVSDISAPTTSRYVPKAPPTVEQVLDGLRRPKAGSKTNKTNQPVIPKPPPPTPSITSPRPSSAKPIKLFTATRPSAHPQRSRRPWIYRTIAFIWFAIMLRLAYGYIDPPTYSAFFHQVRSSSLSTMNAVRGMLPSAQPQAARIYSHIKPPAHVNGTEPHDQVLANITLREFLAENFDLALAPAFFGIYAYVGAFMAWDTTDYMDKIQSVAGSSAGAMAAVILAAGIEPHKVAELGKNMTLQKFADPPGFGGIFKGDKFEAIMNDFILNESPSGIQLMEETTIPVAVTVFDLKSFSGRTLTRGSMAKAARASATFPVLFQPVSHVDGILIDGGVTDMLGLQGLAAFSPNRPKRIVNVAVGGFLSNPPGPDSMPDGVKAMEVLSISILNTPPCGPWAMANGPRAIEAARLAMLESLDLPLFHGQEKGHYELHVDASSFIE